MYRLRIIYSKTGLIRFISHRDLMRVFFRAFQRSGLPVSYSQGFNPHPRVEFCPPLKVGMEGFNELLDVRLSDKVEINKVKKWLNSVMPEGMKIKEVRMLRADMPSLGKSIRETEYRVNLNPPAKVTLNDIRNFLSAPEVLIEYKKAGKTKRVDARKGVLALKLFEEMSGQPRLLMRLSLEEIRPPLNVLAALLKKKPDEFSGIRWQRLHFLGQDL